LARRRGFNAGVFDASIPVAKRIERVVDEEEQVNQLLETKSAFAAGGIWNICGTRIANANVVLRAQKQQVALEAEKSAVQAQGQAARRVKLLVNAQTALQKYRDGGTSKASVLRVNNNNDNFCIDVLYFVPENLKKVQESC
jgi:hypothetical protein